MVKIIYDVSIPEGMGLIGCLHRNVSRAGPQTKVFFASDGGRSDLGELTLFHLHNYSGSQAARSRVQGCAIGEEDTSLVQGSDVLYRGTQPFVIAEVSDAELRQIFDPLRYDDPAFINGVVARYATLRMLTDVLHGTDFLDEKQRGSIYAEMFDKGTVLERPIDEYVEREEVQSHIQQLLYGFRETLLENLDRRGYAGGPREIRTKIFAQHSFTTMKEIDVLEMLLEVQNVVTARSTDGLNAGESPERLLGLIGMQYYSGPLIKPVSVHAGVLDP